MSALAVHAQAAECLAAGFEEEGDAMQAGYPERRLDLYATARAYLRAAEKMRAVVKAEAVILERGLGVAP
jgi:hypothetical protein